MTRTTATGQPLGTFMRRLTHLDQFVLPRKPWNDPDWYAEVESQRQPLHRWLLVEESNINGAFSFATFDSPESAFWESANQEYAEDWEPLLLVDLDTGDSRALIRTFGVDFA